MKRYVILQNPVSSSSRRLPGTSLYFRSVEEPSTHKILVERLPEKDLATLKSDPQIVAVCPTMPTSLIRPFSSTTSEETGNWGISAIGADRSKYTGRDVTVAILDTGIDHDHPAFEGVNLVERDFSGDGDGDKNGHGTHCAGTIFGRDVGGVRIGVARGVSRALVGKVLKDNGSGESDMVFQAMHWALSEKAHIISMSLGFDFPGLVEELVNDGWPTDLATSTALEAYRGNLRMFDSIMSLLKAQGAFGVSPLVVAASGNESRRSVNAEYRIAASLPACANDVLSVAAVGRDVSGFRVADFSNSFPTLSGPGVDILSAWPGGGLHTLSGSSMACPHVAGLAALWWEEARQPPTRSNALNVKSKLIASARRDHSLNNYEEVDLGQGLAIAP